MFAIRVTYLMGRVYSSVFEDGDSKTEPEWPPHPSRLFSALVSAWGEGGQEDELRAGLEWIEKQEPPVVFAGEISRRHVVQAFVPVNDSSKLPEDRARKPRSFPSATLANPDVFFVWNTDPPEKVEAALRALLLRMSSLGHSASLVEADVAENLPATDDNAWRPDARGEVRLRIPYEGRFQELQQRYALFQKTPEKPFRPAVGESALYTRAVPKSEAVSSGVFDQMIVIRRVQGPKASLRSALSLSTALRGAILAKSPVPIPEYLSGHAPGSTAENPIRSEREHVGLVPLPFVDFGYATGEVMGMAVLLPKSLTRDERIVCWDVVSGVETLRMQWGPWEVALTDAEERRTALRVETWTLPSRVWSTVTPFVFDRFPKEPYGPEAEQVVRDAFLRVGFPSPCEIDLHYNPWHTGVPKASAFPPAPARTGKPQRYHCHVRVAFERTIAGPVVAGAGRYYGYGLFRQLSEKEQR